MTTKVSADMYPLNELKVKFGSRIRTTRFTQRTPRVEVNFKLLSNLISRFPEVRVRYLGIIEKSIYNMAFFTEDGFHRLKEVDYMFKDDNQNIVAVLKSGKDLKMLTPPEKGESKILMADCPLHCRVSTSRLKSYYITHREDFPFLNAMAKVLDDICIDMDHLSRVVSESVEKCNANEWIRSNISECIEELSKLMDKSSFVINSTK